MLFALLVALSVGEIQTAQSPTPIAGGAIDGRIVAADGQPLRGIVVSALKQDADAAGRVRPRTAAMTMTDEAGQFHLAGLPAGRYAIVAAPAPSQLLVPAPVPSGTLVATPTYYPGTASSDAAQIITLAAEQAVGDLQISMMSTPGYDVRGVVLDEGGAPLKNVVVTLLIESGDGGIAAPITAHTDQQGAFRISGVVPGAYRVLAGAPMMTATREGSTTILSGLVSGGAAVTGGVFVGGAAGAAGVPPIGMPTPTPSPVFLSTPVDVAVGNGDVTGVKIIVSARK